MKILGHCSKCDKQVFEILKTNPDGTPKRLGMPLDDAMRVTFALFGGSQMSLTFCKACAESLEVADYPVLWGRVMRAWINEHPDHPWAKTQVDNGIAGRLATQHWREV